MQLVSTLVLFHCSRETRARGPNIVLLMVDDMGIGDIPCFGNTSIPMPNVAQLCQQGARLMHHTTPAIFCTPSRTAFLTGRYQVRSGMVGDGPGVSPPVVVFAAGSAGLPQNETTFGSLLKKANYTTGLVGKWHLGLNSRYWGDMEHGPLGHGFDYFYGLPWTLVEGFEEDLPFFSFHRAGILEVLVPLLALLPLRYIFTKRTFFALVFLAVFLSWLQAEHFGLTMKAWWQRSFFMEKFLNSFLMENYNVIEKPIHLPSLSGKLTNKSLEFMKKSAKIGHPFLLFHSFAAVHTPLVTSETFKGRSEHGAYGDTLIELDHAVGLILDALKSLGVEQDTFVYFTSDHGADIEIGLEGGYNGIFRGGKGNAALEGGMRIPGILRWPGVIKEGSIINNPTSLMDILPTLAHIAGLDTSHLKLDGQSLIPLLQEDESVRESRPLFHFCQSEIFAMRMYQGNSTYKLVRKSHPLDRKGHCNQCSCYGSGVISHNPPLLFNLDEDPIEMAPLETSANEYKDYISLMTNQLNAFQEELDKTKMAAQFSNYAVLPRPWLQPMLNVG